MILIQIKSAKRINWLKQIKKEIVMRRWMILLEDRLNKIIKTKMKIKNKDLKA